MKQNYESLFMIFAILRPMKVKQTLTQCTLYAIWHLKNSNIYQYSFIADAIVYF